MSYKYKISVVMAVYNVEEYIDEAINSVINQSIGFKDIQIILVEDGSPDNCAAICDDYVTKYPDNIVVIHKQNEGAARARLDGIKKAEGKYISFLDPDDTLSSETFENIYKFFEENYDKTDMVAMPIYFFGDQTGSHPLNYKFSKGSRVVNLFKEHTLFQMNLASALIKNEVSNLIDADPNLKTAEDAREALRILLNKNTLGLVKEARYNYRRRNDSAIGTSVAKRSWYTNSIKYFSNYILDYSKEILGYIPKYIQSAVMYDLQWKFTIAYSKLDILNVEEKKEFISEIFKVTFRLDDDVILEQRYLAQPFKYHILRKKYDDKSKMIEIGDMTNVSFSETGIFNISNMMLRIEFLKIENNVLKIEGVSEVFLTDVDATDIMFKVNGKLYNCEHIKRYEVKQCLNETISIFKGFKFEVPLENKENNVSFYIKANGKYFQCRNIIFGSFAPINRSNVYKNSFYIKNNWRITYDNFAIHVDTVNKTGAIKNEVKLYKELWKKNRDGERKAILARVAFHMLKCIKKKPLWLISDRTSKAGDNGIAFYMYMRKNHPEIDCYFVINKDCADYNEAKKYGPVVARDSFKHKLMSLLSDYIVSSQGEVQIYNPFHGHSEPYRDILSETKFVFLQHGVIIHDLSGWLNKYNKNLYGFVTSAKDEYNSIVNTNYYYTSNEVWLTGLPRFDRLYNDEQRQITIMPTWRKYLMTDWDASTDSWSTADNFTDSDYYNFYNNLLNDERLIKAAKELGYTIAFFPHPNIQPSVKYFDKKDDVVFLDRTNEYRDVYAKSNLIVTDYSSAVYDFAYMRKPIIYAQFDASEFLNGKHVAKKGYFEYKENGFGEVLDNLDSTVDTIIEYMKNDCQLKDKYRKRIDNFFAYNDKNNCQRVYEKIMEKEKERQQ